MKRSKEFLVPEESILEFSEILEENNLKGFIKGVDDDQLVIEVIYEREQRNGVMQLVELIDGEDEFEDEE